MSIDDFFNMLETKNYESFNDSWLEYFHLFSAEDRQDLLVRIIDELYFKDNYRHLRGIINTIIHPKLNLNFDLDHDAPTLLSLVILRAPSKEIFDYFVRRGAAINYVGDRFAHYTQDEIQKEINSEEERYQTCLDYANEYNRELHSIYYNFVPAKESELEQISILEAKNITISKSDYENLLEQSNYLSKLISVDSLVDHIKALGGKTFDGLPISP